MKNGDSRFHYSGTQRGCQGVNRPSLTYRVELTWQESMLTFGGSAPLTGRLSGGDTLWWIPYGFLGDGRPRAVN